MAKITIDIPDKDIPEVIKSFEWCFKYSKNKRDNETKAQFAKRMLAREVKHILNQYKHNLSDKITNQQISDEMSTIDIN